MSYTSRWKRPKFVVNVRNSNGKIVKRRRIDVLRYLSDQQQPSRPSSGSGSAAGPSNPLSVSVTVNNHNHDNDNVTVSDSHSVLVSVENDLTGEAVEALKPNTNFRPRSRSVSFSDSESEHAEQTGRSAWSGSLIIIESTSLALGLHFFIRM